MRGSDSDFNVGRWEHLILFSVNLDVSVTPTSESSPTPHLGRPSDSTSHLGVNDFPYGARSLAMWMGRGTGGVKIPLQESPTSTYILKVGYPR